MAAALICPALPQAAWTAQRRSSGWNVAVACRTCLLGCPWNLQRAQWQWCARLERWEGAGWAFRTLTFISLSSYPCSVPFLHLPQPQTLQIMRFQETRALPLAPTLRSRPLSTSSAHFRAQASSIWLPCAFDSRKTNDKLGPAPRRTKTYYATWHGWKMLKVVPKKYQVHRYTMVHPGNQHVYDSQMPKVMQNLWLQTDVFRFCTNIILDFRGVHRNEAVYPFLQFPACRGSAQVSKFLRPSKCQYHDFGGPKCTPSASVTSANPKKHEQGTYMKSIAKIPSDHRWLIWL